VARRSLGSNHGNEFGDVLEGLVAEIEQDVEVLEDVMRRLSVGEDRVKRGGAKLGELLGRLKLNGQISGYSPLSRLVELEVLALGVEGKLSLWRTLAGLGDADLADVDFGVLIARAEDQRDRIEASRVSAARIAFGAAA
jgi:hypothetical protein